MKFNEKIYKLRKMKGLTQDEFASAVGVSRQAVYKWESGQSYPEVPKLLEIKLLFDISLDDLLNDNYEVVVPEKQKKKRTQKPKEPSLVTSGAPAEEDITVELTIEEPAEESAPLIEELTVEQTPVEETPAVEEAPVAEEAPVVEEAPVAEEIPAVEEAPVTEEAPVVEEAPTQQEAPTPEKKKGFFARLFGKK